MSVPFERKVASGVTSATVSDPVDVINRTNVGIFVVAENLDKANDTLEILLEVGVDGMWADAKIPPTTSGNSPPTLDFTEDSFQDRGDGMSTAYLFEADVAASQVRANVRQFVDDAGSDLSLEVYLTGSQRNTKR